MIERDPWYFASVSEMRVLAKEHRLAGYSAMRREELCVLLDQAGVQPPPVELARRADPAAQSTVSPRHSVFGKEITVARPPRDAKVRVVDGTYVGTRSDGVTVEVSLVNPDTRRWQIVRRDPVWGPKSYEVDDWQLGQFVGVHFAPKQLAIARTLIARIRRDYPGG